MTQQNIYYSADYILSGTGSRIIALLNGKVYANRSQNYRNKIAKQQFEKAAEIWYSHGGQNGVQTLFGMCQYIRQNVPDDKIPDWLKDENVVYN